MATISRNSVKIFTDWDLARGTNIADSLIIKLCGKEEKISSDLDEIVSFDRSIHLQPKNDDSNTSYESTEIKYSCDINFQIDPEFFIDNIAIITDCQNAEIFRNVQKEYSSTVYGEFLDDFDGMQVYRLDIQTYNLDNMITIKLIPKIPKIWIYGMQIVLINNSKPLVGGTGINIENVQKILSNSNQKLSPNAERCKSFVQNYMISKKGSIECSKVSPGILENLMSMFNITTSENEPPNINEIMSTAVNSNNQKITNGNICDDGIDKQHLEQLKEYFRITILETENRIYKHIEDVEKRQNEKLDEILNVLKTFNTKT